MTSPIKNNLAFLARGVQGADADHQPEKHSVLVMGGTGLVGGAVVRGLLSFPWYRVLVATRRPWCADALLLKQAGAVLLEVDYNYKHSLVVAMKGVKCVFLHTIFWENYSGTLEVLHGKNAVEAAQEAGVEHLVFDGTNYVKPEQGRVCGFLRSKMEIENIIVMSGIAYTIVVLPFYYENFLTVFRPYEIHPDFFAITIPLEDCLMSCACLHDMALCIAKIIQQGKVYYDQKLTLAAEMLSVQQIISNLNSCLKGLNFIDPELTIDDFQEFAFPGAKDLAAMFLFYQLCEDIPDFSITRTLNPHTRNMVQWIMDNKEQLYAVLDEIAPDEQGDFYTPPHLRFTDVSMPKPEPEHSVDVVSDPSSSDTDDVKVVTVTSKPRVHLFDQAGEKSSNKSNNSDDQLHGVDLKDSRGIKRSAIRLGRPDTRTRSYMALQKFLADDFEIVSRLHSRRHALTGFEQLEENDLRLFDRTYRENAVKETGRLLRLVQAVRRFRKVSNIKRPHKHAPLADSSVQTPTLEQAAVGEAERSRSMDGSQGLRKGLAADTPESLSRPVHKPQVAVPPLPTVVQNDKFEDEDDIDVGLFLNTLVDLQMDLEKTERRDAGEQSPRATAATQDSLARKKDRKDKSVHVNVRGETDRTNNKPVHDNVRGETDRTNNKPVHDNVRGETDRTNNKPVHDNVRGETDRTNNKPVHDNVRGETDRTNNKPTQRGKDQQHRWPSVPRAPNLACFPRRHEADYSNTHYTDYSNNGSSGQGHGGEVDVQAPFSGLGACLHSGRTGWRRQDSHPPDYVARSVGPIFSLSGEQHDDNLPGYAGGFPDDYTLPGYAGGFPDDYTLPGYAGGFPDDYNLPGYAGGADFSLGLRDRNASSSSTWGLTKRPSQANSWRSNIGMPSAVLANPGLSGCSRRDGRSGYSYNHVRPFCYTLGGCSHKQSRRTSHAVDEESYNQSATPPPADRGSAFSPQGLHKKDELRGRHVDGVGEPSSWSRGFPTSKSRRSTVDTVGLNSARQGGKGPGSLKANSGRRMAGSPCLELPENVQGSGSGRSWRGTNHDSVNNRGPFTSSNDRGPFTSSNDRGPFTSSNDRGPFTSSNNRGPFTSSNNRGPFTSSNNRGPFTSSNDRGPFTSSNNRGPFTSSNNRGPFTSSNDRGPFTSSNDRGPFTSSNDRGPFTSSNNRGPFTSSNDRGPFTSSNDRGPFTSSNDRGPFTSSNDRGPFTSSNNRGPFTSSNDRGPFTSSNNRGPFTSSNDRGPFTSSNDRGPFTSSNDRGPFTSSNNRGPFTSSYDDSTDMASSDKESHADSHQQKRHTPSPGQYTPSPGQYTPSPGQYLHTLDDDPYHFELNNKITAAVKALCNARRERQLNTTPDTRRERLLNITSDTRREALRDTTPDTRREGVMDITPDTQRERLLNTTPDTRREGLMDITPDTQRERLLNTTPDTRREGVRDITPDTRREHQLNTTPDTRREDVMDTTPETLVRPFSPQRSASSASEEEGEDIASLSPRSSLTSVVTSTTASETSYEAERDAVRGFERRNQVLLQRVMLECERRWYYDLTNNFSTFPFFRSSERFAFTTGVRVVDDSTDMLTSVDSTDTSASSGWDDDKTSNK